MVCWKQDSEIWSKPKTLLWCKLEGMVKSLRRLWLLAGRHWYTTIVTSRNSSKQAMKFACTKVSRKPAACACVQPDLSLGHDCSGHVMWCVIRVRCGPFSARHLGTLLICSTNFTLSTLFNTTRHITCSSLSLLEVDLYYPLAQSPFYSGLQSIRSTLQASSMSRSSPHSN